MNDPAFPDSHTTTTTTTTSTVQSPPLTIDKGYITSIPGILRIVEIVVGFLYWILLATCGYAVGFPLFVGISCWVLTICLFVVFVLSLDKRVTIINWLLTELINNLIWTILHFIGACIAAARAARAAQFYLPRNGGLAFAAFLGFALVILYGVSTFFNFRVFQAGGGLARLTGGSGGAGGTATTTSVTTTEYPGEKGMDAPPPYSNP